jgi:N-acetylmuramoyl-L-alanine amidase
MKYSNFCVFLDAGHGSINPSTNKYTTLGKYYYHGKYDYEFHGGKMFYEGVSNRRITYAVSKKLYKEGIPSVIVSHPYLDNSLKSRVDLANKLATSFRKTIYISNHSNAGGGRGFEIFTSIGYTKADTLANIYFNNMEYEFGSEIKYRKGNGELFKEANFYVLRNTSMPAILPEHLFFDDIDDALFLINSDNINRIADVQVKSIKDFFNIS